MQRSSHDPQYRFRLQKLADTLREFGLVDRYDLADLLRRPELPGVEAVTKRLGPCRASLPPNVTPRYVAQALLRILKEPDPDTQAWNRAHVGLACLLDRISTGQKAARRYHRHIAELLTAIFEGMLENPVVEQSIDDDLKFIDITFDNCASSGFFQQVRDERKIQCTYVVFECKNYGDDPGNPEYDQLSGRLSGKRTMLGFLVCRALKNRKKAQRHCRQRRNDKDEYILVLEDSDIIRLFNLRRKGDIESINRTLLDKLRTLDF